MKAHPNSSADASGPRAALTRRFQPAFSLTALLLTTSLLTPAVTRAQLSEPNAAGVAMGHLHYRVADPEANRQFWIRLGGEATTFEGLPAVQFPGLIVVLEQGPSSGGTEGSVINHVAFRVQSLEAVESAGFEVDYLEEYPGVASVSTPEGERIELFDDQKATNIYFTFDSGQPDPVADRHNRPLEVPIASHHLHFYLPESAVAEARAWYTRMFGGVPGKRWRYDAVDLPGINLNFSAAPGPTAPTRGRMLDHIGFQVENLEKLVQRLAAEGASFDVPYRKDAHRAVLTDPWGTTIELTE